MENNSTYNSFDIFNFEMPVEESDDKEKGVELPNIPEDVKKVILKYGNRLSGLSMGRKQIDFNFED